MIFPSKISRNPSQEALSENPRLESRDRDRVKYYRSSIVIQIQLLGSDFGYLWLVRCLMPLTFSDHNETQQSVLIAVLYRTFIVFRAERSCFLDKMRCTSEFRNCQT